MADVNAYSVTITVNIPIETFTGSGINMSASMTFWIQVNDPCNSAIMSYNPAIADMQAFVNLGPDT